MLDSTKFTYINIISDMIYKYLQELKICMSSSKNELGPTKVISSFSKQQTQESLSKKERPLFKKNYLIKSGSIKLSTNYKYHYREHVNRNINH